MYEEDASRIADAIGGETYQSGGNCWLAYKQKAKSIVVFSDDCIVEVADPNHEGAYVIGLTEELAVINLYD
jgi:hypothetical protein